MTTQESVARWKVLGFGPPPPIWSSRNIPCSWSTSPDRLVLGYALLAFGTAFEVIKGAPKLVVERCELVSKVVRLTTGSDPI